jgi:hypothetical protein
MAHDHAASVRALFDEGEVREVLAGTFYNPGEETGIREIPPAKALSGRRKKAAKPKPDHYEIICISMYVEDLARLDQKVAELKSRGHRRATRSALIRAALDQLDLDKVPRGI